MDLRTNIYGKYICVTKCITLKQPRLVIPARTIICRLTNLMPETVHTARHSDARLRYRKT